MLAAIYQVAMAVPCEPCRPQAALSMILVDSSRDVVHNFDNTLGAVFFGEDGGTSASR